MDWLGHWAAVELTIQFWLGRTGPATTMGMVALATLLLIAGTHTYSGTLSLWITPPFLWLLGRAVRAYGHPGLPAAGIGRGGRSWRTVVAAAGASALAFGLGGALAGLLSLYRADLTRWSNDLLLGSATRTRSGLSTNPELGPTFRLSGTLERVLRLTGDPLPNHLRAHVFTQYRLGRWGPPVESRPRRLFEGSLPAPRGPLAPVRCEALKPTDGYLFTALESVGVDPGGNREVDWDFSTTGSLHSQDDPPEPWALLFPLGAAGPDPPQVGSLSRQGEPGEESRAVPAELDPRVRDLARTLA
ncbi:MAG: hypothetical protein FJX77_12875, partial [Armatimonadetes bacterium]|nr:hypothetical protein [Armatimonadota bacterium]